MSLLFGEVVQELKKSRSEPTPISQSRVLNWMEKADDDADALGAIYVFLSKIEHTQRVKPPLSFDPVFDFMLRYYEFCLESDPESKWANNRYSAGWDLVGWFVWMWDEERDKKYFIAIRSSLAQLYVTGDAELKKCIEYAVIEHLFERKPIRKFFADWKDNPQLRPAYEHAMLWVKGGGTSPLTERPRR